MTEPQPESGFLVPPGPTSAFSAYFDEHMPAVLAYLDQLEPVTGQPAIVPFIAATKQVSYIEVPNELLMDAGLIPDTREHKPVPRRTRLRWWLGTQRERAAELAYRLVSGHDVPERDY